MTLNILSYRIPTFMVSLLLSLFACAMIFFWNLNFGIDMTWGIQLEYDAGTGTIDLDQLKTEAETVAGNINLQEKNVISTINLYKISGQNNFVVEAGISKHLTDAQSETFKTAFREQLTESYKKNNMTLGSYVNIWASFGDYIQSTAKLTILIALIGISVYVAYAFSGTVGGISSLSFAAITLITLFHDVLVAAGLYIMTSYFLPQFQIDTFFITALLTILGYSINDTIVIFDRIRSNLREFGGRGKDLATIITEAINDTITRSIYTSLTVVFVLICILVFWPESIQGFTLTMLYGTIVGTFSSIFIASPMLYEFHKNTTLQVYQKKEDRSAEDKMVV